MNQTLRNLMALFSMLFLLVSCNPTTLRSPAVTPNLPQEQAPSPVPPTNTPASTAVSIPPAPLPEVTSLMGLEIGERNQQDQTNLAIESGALWIRRNGLLWSNIEPEQGLRQWEAAEMLESQLKRISENGKETILIVRSTPAWAQREPGVLCGPVHPDQFGAFGQFMYDAVTRYSQPPYNIKYWELGNEPDVGVGEVRPQGAYGCWGSYDDPYFDGGFYAEMLKVVYPQIKAADPEAQVLVGGLLLGCDPNNPPVNQAGEPQNCLSARFLEGILLNDGGNYFDGISFHAYDYYYPLNNTYGNTNWHSGQLPDKSAGELIPVTVAKARYIRALLTQYGHPDKYLINSETALICGRDGKEEACQTEQFQITKSRYLVQSYIIAYAEGLRANIWYSLFGWRASGLVTSDLKPHPVFTAYQFAAGQLGQAVFVQSLAYPGALAFQFQTSQKNLWVMWSANGDPITVDLPTTPQNIYDVFGASLPSVQQITIDAGPVYLEWLVTSP